MLLFHGVSDNRTGVLAHAEFLLRQGQSIVTMDSRAHGKSGGAMCTYDWKVTILSRLRTPSTQARVFATFSRSGCRWGRLQSAAVEGRIEAVAAESPFANLREVSYDYAGLGLPALLGKTLFRPAVIVAMDSIEGEGRIQSRRSFTEKAVSERPFPVLLICDTWDHRIPRRHAKRIYEAARGPKQLWFVKGAGHAAALGYAPAEYERCVVGFFAAEASALGQRFEPF